MKLTIVAQIGLEHPKGSVFHLLEVAENLQRLGYRIHLIVPDLGRYPGKTSISIHYVPTLRVKFLWILIWQILLFFFLLLRCLRNRPNILYIRSGAFLVVPAFIADLLNIHRVYEVNSSITEELKLKNRPRFLISLVHFFEKHTYRKAALVIVVTNKLKKTLSREFNLKQDRIFVIPNGVNTSLYKPEDMVRVRSRLGLKSPGPYIIYVGTFAPWQGLQHIVSCASKIRQQFPDIRFLIIGDGMEREIIHRSIRTLEIEDLFVFTGWIQYEIVPSYINAADVCVAPFDKKLNQYTGKSPLKVFAYWACAKPVVATDIPEIGDLVKNVGAGVVVPPNDVQQLTSAILSLLENPALASQMGKKGREIVEKEYSWTSITEEINTLLTDGRIIS